DQIGSLPGVEGIAQASVTPLDTSRFNTIFFLAGEQQGHLTQYNPVSPEFFSVVGIPIVRGRTFAPADSANSAVIVTESTARRFWPGSDPIGKTFEMSRPGNRPSTREIVGVAKDAQVSSIGETDTVYLYTLADPGEQSGARVLVRSAVNFASM